MKKYSSTAITLLIVLFSENETLAFLNNHGKRANFSIRHSLKSGNQILQNCGIFENKSLRSTNNLFSSMKETDASLFVDESDLDENSGRYDDLLAKVGLSGQISSLNDLPPKPSLSVNDVFCNRELKLSSVKAIGFDMDYTLAQYLQPEFDKLAFDGAKEKLVKALGYPKEVLDFEYDHEVSSLIA